MSQSIHHFLSELRSAVARRLPEIMRLRNTREEKADASYVTQGDLLVQKIVLQLTADLLPAAQVISEEQKEGAHDGAAGITIVVDPIDGTENFTSGLPEWGVSVACYQDGRHVASMIGCPEMDIWIQTGDTLERHASRIHGLSSSLSKEDIIRATEGFEYRILGCCVYNMMNVIRGSFCSFENPKGAHSWDILAGLNLALEHGLTVSVEGKPYRGEYLEHTRKYRFRVTG